MPPDGCAVLACPRVGDEGADAGLCRSAAAMGHDRQGDLVGERRHGCPAVVCSSLVVESNHAVSGVVSGEVGEPGAAVVVPGGGS